MFDQVEENLYLPTLGIQVVDQLRGEARLKDIGDVETPLFFMKQADQTYIVLEGRVLGLGEVHGQIDCANSDLCRQEIIEFRKASPHQMLEFKVGHLDDERVTIAL